MSFARIRFARTQVTTTRRRRNIDEPRQPATAGVYLPLPRRLLIHASMPASSFRARAKADSANLS